VPYGGRGAVLRGAGAEIVFSLLVEPVGLINKSLALLRLALGWRSGWAPQNRADRGVAWGDAARLLWPHTLIGVGCAAALATVSPAALAVALPFLAGAVLAVPLCVVTAAPGFSALLVRHRVAATPEERAGPMAAGPSRTQDASRHG